MDGAAKPNRITEVVPRFRVRRLMEVTLLILAIGLFFSASHWSGVPICPTRGLLGIPCAGCGMTRATLALLRFDLTDVFHYHPLAPFIVPLLGYTVGALILEYVGLIAAGQWPSPPRWIWPTMVIALALIYAIRLGGGLGGLPDRVAPDEGMLLRGFSER